MTIKVTQALKSFLVESESLDVAADDAAVKTATGAAIAEGRLTPAKYAELVADEDTPAANAFEDRLSRFEKGLDTLLERFAGGNAGGAGEAPGGSEEPPEEPRTPKGEQPEWQKGLRSMMSGDGFEAEGEPRVKGAWEAYGTTKSALMYPATNEKGKPHPLAGQQVHDFADGVGKALDTTSERDRAINGAYSKFMVACRIYKSRNLAFNALNQHDKELLYYALKEMKWCGYSGGGDPNYADIIDRKLTPSEQKAIIDDSVSGGTEAAPISFDADVIQRPLLHGELFPLVNVKPIDRGRRIEGVSTGTVTGSWGGVDDTAISLFNTNSYISAFDTTIYRWEGAITIGLDFLSDTPIDFGTHVIEQYGERLLEDLDDVIAAGNGTTQPEGIINKSGATSVAFGGATSIGNYESLRFGVAKNEHRSNVVRSAVFCGTETSYQRAMAIPVGASDARRLFGSGMVGGTETYDDYNFMKRPYKINESLTNQQIFYAILARYRMYRRRGLTMRTSTEGDTLIRNNEMLIACTARYGGQQERGATVALTTTAPA